MNGSSKNLVEYAGDLIRILPRIDLSNISTYGRKKRKSIRSSTGYAGKGKNGRRSYFPVGSEGRENPFYMKFPKENYYKELRYKREYPPVSLLQLQKMIDLNRLDITKPIDLAAICKTHLYNLDPSSRHYGINLTDEGADQFCAKVNIEVQWTSEPVIAAIEKNGGVITTAYYDIRSVEILKNPEEFFRKGEAIPNRLDPPDDAILFYTSAATRGYLADPEKISWERLVLAQKYGYKLPKIENDPDYGMLIQRKDPRQIFYGLEPGWIINLRDKCILKTISSNLK